MSDLVPFDAAAHATRVVSVSGVRLERAGTIIDVQLGNIDDDPDEDQTLDVRVRAAPNEIEFHIGDKLDDDASGGGFHLATFDKDGQWWGAQWAVAPGTFDTSDLYNADDDTIAQVAAGASVKPRGGGNAQVPGVAVVRAVLNAYAALLDERAKEQANAAATTRAESEGTDAVPESH